MMYSGHELNEIPDPEYLTLETAHAAVIIRGLDLSGIVYHAKADENVVYLAFSAGDRPIVDEIAAKAESGDYEEMMLSLSENGSDGYAPLYQEIADILHCAVGSVTSCPPEVIESLAKTYINYWHSDKQTIQRALERIIDLNTETENELAEMSLAVTMQNNTPEKRMQSEAEDRSHSQAAADRETDRKRIEDSIIIEADRSVFLSAEARKRLAEDKKRQTTAQEHREQENTRERRKF